MAEVPNLRTWQFLRDHVRNEVPVAMLYVVDSDGSSPGRKDFVMAATADLCTGTIGGGIMEHKLVELSRKHLKERSSTVTLRTQFHDKDHDSDQSGMICSGMQRVAILTDLRKHFDAINSCIESLTKDQMCQIEISPQGFFYFPGAERMNEFLFVNEDSWRYVCSLGWRSRLHIIGGGHVSLALSEIMSKLGFYVIVYDDRQDLNTFQDNHAVSEKHLVDYNNINNHVTTTAEDYLAIMTIGYRTDKVVLRQLLDKPCRYLGMLGSAAKVEQLFTELRGEGISSLQLDKVHAPIGLQVHSKTSVEIAVSIAAEIISEKNRKPD
jgi:xanthine dehydrogenase accessory factor